MNGHATYSWRWVERLCHFMHGAGVVSGDPRFKVKQIPVFPVACFFGDNVLRSTELKGGDDVVGHQLLLFSLFVCPIGIAVCRARSSQRNGVQIVMMSPEQQLWRGATPCAVIRIMHQINHGVGVHATQVHERLFRRDGCLHREGSRQHNLLHGPAFDVLDCLVDVGQMPVLVGGLWALMRRVGQGARLRSLASHDVP